MCLHSVAASFNFDISLGIQTGENGVISSPSKASLTVTANDDPNGLMRFEKRSVEIPEDYNPGMKATTTKNVTVLRDQGSWGSIQVRFATHVGNLENIQRIEFTSWACTEAVTYMHLKKVRVDTKRESSLYAVILTLIYYWKNALEHGWKFLECLLTLPCLG